MRKIIPILILALAFMAMAGCSSLDCPLNNTVYSKYKLDGNIKQLTQGTLTVFSHRINGEDTILLNMQENADSFMLPMSYSGHEDSLFFEVRNNDEERVFLDTVTVAKENHPHFESVDCSPSFFHTIVGIKTTHNLIDSIVIKQKDVNFDATKTHFLIYFGTRNNE